MVCQHAKPAKRSKLARPDTRVGRIRPPKFFATSPADAAILADLRLVQGSDVELVKPILKPLLAANALLVPRNSRSSALYLALGLAILMHLVYKQVRKPEGEGLQPGGYKLEVGGKAICAAARAGNAHYAALLDSMGAVDKGRDGDKHVNHIVKDQCERVLDVWTREERNALFLRLNGLVAAELRARAEATAGGGFYLQPNGDDTDMSEDEGPVTAIQRVLPAAKKAAEAAAVLPLPAPTTHVAAHACAHEAAMQELIARMDAEVAAEAKEAARAAGRPVELLPAEAAGLDIFRATGPELTPQEFQRAEASLALDTLAWESMDDEFCAVLLAPRPPPPLSYDDAVLLPI